MLTTAVIPVFVFAVMNFIFILKLGKQTRERSEFLLKEIAKTNQELLALGESVEKMDQRK